MSILTSQTYTFKSVLKLTIPTMIMMVCLSLYTIVDGIFVARFVGENALAAISIVLPFNNIANAIAIMLATGSSAIIARELGRKKENKAKRIFTFIILVSLLVGILLSLFAGIFTKEIISVLGGANELYPYCYDYLWVLSIFIPATFLQALFQVFFATAGKARLGLIIIIFAGITNVVLDYIFIVEFSMGIAGAAYATGMSQCITAVLGLGYFLFARNQSLYIIRPKLYWSALKEACYNGSSEMVINLAFSLTTIMFNYLMLTYIGNAGVTAIGIVLYAQYVLLAIFMGFSTGIAPAFSYNYGSNNKTALKSLFKLSFRFILGASVVITFLGYALVNVFVGVFANPGTYVFELAHSGFLIFIFSFLFVGVNVFASGLFTALSNGKVSAIISFLRAFGFTVLCMLILPPLLGVTGIWLVLPLAEFLTVAISLYYIVKMGSIYHYFNVPKKVT